MALKSKLVFQDPRLALTLKAIIFGALLAFASAVPSWGSIPVLLYIGISLLLFKNKELGAPPTFVARALLLVAALLLTSMLSNTDFKFLVYIFSIRI